MSYELEEFKFKIGDIVMVNNPYLEGHRRVGTVQEKRLTYITFLGGYLDHYRAHYRVRLNGESVVELWYSEGNLELVNSDSGEYNNEAVENLKGQVDLIYVNEKKQQVVIKWKDGTTTKATCQEGDEFDLLTGFTIAFNRKLFKSDKASLKFIESKIVKDQKEKYFREGE